MRAFFWGSIRGLHWVLKWATTSAFWSDGFYVAERSDSSGSDIQPSKQGIRLNLAELQITINPKKP